MIDHRRWPLLVVNLIILKVTTSQSYFKSLLVTDNLNFALSFQINWKLKMAQCNEKIVQHADSLHLCSLNFQLLIHLEYMPFWYISTKNFIAKWLGALSISFTICWANLSTCSFLRYVWYSRALDLKNCVRELLFLASKSQYQLFSLIPSFFFSSFY